jgi:hypothetical protein
VAAAAAAEVGCAYAGAVVGKKKGEAMDSNSEGRSECRRREKKIGIQDEDEDEGGKQADRLTR